MAETGDRRIVVVGGSSGVGRAVAVECWRRGHRVAVIGRREGHLDALRQECPGILAASADVRDRDSIAAAVQAGAAQMGGIDGVLYASAVSRMDNVVDVDLDEWRRMFDTNVAGAAFTFRAARTYLEASRGRMYCLSSISAYKPKPFLVPYAASKAALRKLLEGLRSEHPAVGFGLVTIGNTAPSDFNRDVDPAVVARAVELYQRKGFMRYSAMEAPDVARMIVTAFEAPMVVEDLTLLGPSRE
ncbi:MAG: SDR family oxidoreductase [Gammaproteobacteria bacterium]